MAQQAHPLAVSLQHLMSHNSTQLLAEACEVLLATVRNVTLHPEDHKYRKIRMANPRFNSKLLSLKGGLEVSKSTAHVAAFWERLRSL